MTLKTRIWISSLALIGAGAATAVTVLALKKDNNNRDAGIQIQKNHWEHLQHQKTNSSMHNVPYAAADFNDDSKAKLKILRDLRINEGNGWEPIGDTVIDSVNDLRYAVWKEANGNNVARNALKDFFHSVPHWHNVLSTNTTSALYMTPKYKSSKIGIESANNFLNSGDLSLKTGIGAGLNEDGSSGLNPDGTPATGGTRFFGFKDPNELKTMVAVRPSWRTMAWAEYRAQQIEWNGGFHGDGHNSVATQQRTEPNPINQNGLNMNDKPNIWISGEQSMWENFGLITNVTPSLMDNQLSRVTTWEAWSAMFELFVDEGGSTYMAHRANILGAKWKYLGWSSSIAHYDKIKHEINISMLQEFASGNDTKGIKDDFGWIKSIKNQNTAWFKEHVDYSSLPSNWESLSSLDRAVKFLNTEIIRGDNLYSVKDYGVKLEDIIINELDDIQKYYHKFSNTPIKLKPYSGIDVPTYIYDVIGSGTQALYDDNTYNKWREIVTNPL